VKIKFENFSLFDNQNEYEISPLTFLIGGNNCGKSTFIKALEVIKNQGFDSRKFQLFDPESHSNNSNQINFYFEVSIGLFRLISISFNDGIVWENDSIKYVNEKNDIILQIENSHGNEKSIKFYAFRFLNLIEKSGKIDDYNALKQLFGENELYDKVLKRETPIKYVWDFESKIQEWESWFFEHGLQELLEIEEKEIEFINVVNNYFTSLFKPISFYSFHVDKNNYKRFWNKNQKPLSMEVIRNYDLSLPKRYYSTDDFMSKLIEFQSQFPKVIPEYEFYDINFRKKWLKKFFNEENPIEINLFNHGLFDLKLNGRYLTEQGSGITKILQYIHLFSALTFRVNSDNNSVIIKLDKGQSLEEIQLDVIKNRVSEPLNQKKIIFIEEPEVHLHPNFQSLFAEMIFDLALNSNHHVIIETHSEYIIRKIQLMVANLNDVPTEFINILNFGSDKNLGKVNSIRINSNGGLTDSFFPGFFDEAHNLKFELLKINKHQSN
jgi:predicted ATP-dependent endonuclease of OLD family